MRRKNAVTKLRRLPKQYGIGENAVLALRNVNFSIVKSEFTAIMGLSCGKTTLLNAIAAIDTAAAPQLILADEPTAALASVSAQGLMRAFIQLSVNWA